MMIRTIHSALKLRTDDNEQVDEDDGHDHTSHIGAGNAEEDQHDRHPLVLRMRLSLPLTLVT